MVRPSRRNLGKCELCLKEPAAYLILDDPDKAPMLVCSRCEQREYKARRR